MKIKKNQVYKSTKVLSLVALGLSGILLNSAIYADGILVEPAQLQWHPVIGLGGGVAVTTNLGQSKTFPIVNPATDELYNYTRSGPSQSTPLFEAFLGAEHDMYSNWRGQLGLAYAQTGAFTSRGAFTQGADPQSSDQYNYQFKAITRQLLVQGKLMRPYKNIYFPYLLLGLGVSFNTASSYSTTVPPFLTFTREYSNNTNSTFSYRAGLGVDFALSTHARVGIGYRFSSLGGVQLGRANIDNISVAGTLSQLNLNANEAVAQFTYVI